MTTGPGSDGPWQSPQPPAPQPRPGAHPDAENLHAAHPGAENPDAAHPGAENPSARQADAGGLRRLLSPRRDRLAQDALASGPPPDAGPADVEALLGAVSYHVSIPVEARLRRRAPLLRFLVQRLRRRHADAVLAGVRLRRWAADPRNAEVAGNWVRINRETRGGVAATALLAPWAAAVVAVVIAVADYAYFAGLLGDLADLQEGDYSSSAAVMARALAVTTPLMVLCVCAPAGAVVAAWLRGARPSRRMFGLGVALVLATLGISALFAAFARFRFAAESAGIGAAQAPTALLAILLGALPLLAALAGGLLEAPPGREYRVGRRAHRGVQREGRRAQRAALRRRRMLENAHGRLRSCVAGLLSRHLDAPAQIAEHTVLTARARSGLPRPDLDTDHRVEDWWGDPGRPLPLRGTRTPVPPAALRRLGESVDALRQNSPDRLQDAVDDAYARTDLLPAHQAAPSLPAPAGSRGHHDPQDRDPQDRDLQDRDLQDRVVDLREGGEVRTGAAATANALHDGSSSAAQDRTPPEPGTGSRRAPRTGGGEDGGTP